MSVRLDTLEEQLQSSGSVRQTGGVTIEELEKERDALKKRRDTMDAQLKDNTVLTVEVRKKGACVCDSGCPVVRPFVLYTSVYLFSFVLFDLCVSSRRTSITCSSWRKLLKLWMQLWSLKTAPSRTSRRSY